MPRIKGFDEIQAELLKHPGKIAHDEWLNLKRIFVDIYQKNRRDLVKLLEEPSKNDDLSIELFQNVKPPVVREIYTNELLRNLFNYLSSLSSLVDASMRLTGKYNKEQIADYIVIKEALTRSDINDFFGRLRNYIQHYGIPPLGWTIQLNENTPNSCVYFLSNDKLLAWQGWSSKSKRYIGNQDLDLLKSINDHGKLIDEVFKTLLNTFTDIHTDDIESYNKLMRRRNDILSGK